MRKLLVMMAIVGMATAALAQTPLTLQEALKVGLENSKSLKISELSSISAEAKYHEVNANRWASLAFQGRYTRLSEIPPSLLTLPVSIPGFGNSFQISPNVFNNYDLELSVKQPIFTGFQLLNSSKAAKENAEAAGYDTKTDKANLKVQIATAYWNVYNAEQAEEFMQENLDRTRSHYQQAENMMAQGMLTQSDVLSAKVQVSNGELMLLNAQNNVKLAEVSLNNVLGVPLDTKFQIKSIPQAGDTTLPKLGRLLNQALEHRSELRSLGLKARAAGAMAAAAWGAYLPQVSIVGNFYYQKPNQRIFPTENVFKDTWDASLVVSLPIWNWGQTQSKVDEAKAQSEQAQLAEQQAADNVYLDVTQSYLNFKQSIDRIRVAAATVKDAEESYRISDQKFKVGLVTNTDLMDSEVALLQAKLNYSQALTDLEIARVGLEKATGEL